MDEVERPYDGCGKCLLGVRRLSRVKAATTSPERQREDVLTAAAAVDRLGRNVVDCLNTGYKMRDKASSSSPTATSPPEDGTEQGRHVPPAITHQLVGRTGRPVAWSARARRPFADHA
ncbi:hypothetical protein ACH4A8_03970 [Streptomyces vietnamensis]|uniref:hypothetical protein n=1 Tax=Streptomyces vietnamensis TaxID=362257 RepID=UPI003791478E